MKRPCSIAVAVLGLLAVVGPATHGYPRHIPPPTSREASRLVHDLYHIGKRRDVQQTDVVLTALKQQRGMAVQEGMVIYVAWLTLGRLENPRALETLEEMGWLSKPGSRSDGAIAQARIRAAAAIPRVATPADLARKVEVFLGRLGVTVADLNRLREEIEARKGIIDGLDTPPFPCRVLDTLSEIVADAKSRGINTANIEQTVNFPAWGYGSLRLTLAGLSKQERIRFLVERLASRDSEYDYAASQALANEGSAAIPAIAAKLAEIHAQPARFAPKAAVGLLDALRCIGDPAAISAVIPFRDDAILLVSQMARGTIQSLENGTRILREPDY